MRTPRMDLCMHLGFAVAHATSTDPDGLKACGEEIAHALGELYALQGLIPEQAESDARLLAEIKRKPVKLRTDAELARVLAEREG